MPASLTFPTGPNFPGQLTPLNAKWSTRASEGDRSVAANIAWGVDDLDPGGTATGVVNFNLTAIATQEFSQIAALYVDNLQSGSDVDFIFQDTQFRLTVPAGTQGLYPVISRARSFAAVAPTAIAGDATFMQILNTLPPPVALEKSVFMSAALVSGISVAATGVFTVLAAGMNGTITAIEIIIAAATAAGGSAQVGVALVDGAAETLAATAFGLATGGFLGGVIILNLSGVSLRFLNGLQLALTKTGVGVLTGSLVINVYYRTP